METPKTKDELLTEKKQATEIRKEYRTDKPVRIQQMGDEYFLSIGNYKISETYNNLQTAENECLTPNIDTLVHLINAMLEINKK